LVKIRWLGHSAFEISTQKITVYIDPFLSGNPKAALKANEIKKADFILVTHDHFDHIGDSVDIAKRTGATLIAVPEVASSVGGNIKTVAPNIGSMVNLNGLKVAFVQAFHTSDKGAPTGIVFTVEEKTIYHAGDTGLFGDMKLIGEVYNPEVALLPIGGYYTMGPVEAAIAVSLIKPKVVIPMHYGTFPVLEQTPEKFVEEAKKRAPTVKVVVLNPGETYEV